MFRTCLIIVYLLSCAILFADDRTPPAIIYEEIKQAIGDPDVIWPTLKVIDRKKSIAAFRKSDNTILLEEEAIKVCNRLGSNAAAALAFLIGHELTHFYRHKEWNEMGFGFSFSLDSLSWNTYRDNEYEADLYGVFLAYLAHYDVREILPTLLDQLYEEYDIPEKETTSYPSLRTRKSVFEKMRKQVEILIRLYESAHLCQAIDQSFIAAKSYEYILQFVQTHALHKNYGISLLKSASLGSNDAILKYWMPLGIERDLPVRGLDFKDRQEMLRKALSSFQQAISLKQEDFESELGLTLTYGLLSDFQAAQTKLDTILAGRYQPLEMAKFHLVRGILFALQNKELDATLSWKLARRLDSSPSMRQMVKYNLQVLREKSTGRQEEPQLIKVLKDYDPGVRESSIHLLDTDSLMKLRLNFYRSGGKKTVTYSNPNIQLGLMEVDTQLAIPTSGQEESNTISRHSWGYYQVDWRKQLIYDIRNDRVHAVYAFGLIKP